MMVLEKAHEDKIIEAVRRAAESVEHGEVQIKIEETRNTLDVVVVTQERVRLEKKITKTA
jgi:hypothetical protein